MNCDKCGQEFTENDDALHNWKESYGSTTHVACPGDTCTICKKPITFEDSESTIFVGYRKHKTCRMGKISLSKSPPADPSSWILRS